MKKTLLLFLLFCIYQAEAQVTFDPGVRAGANFSRYTHLEGDTKTDFYVGIFGALKLSRFYTFQPEIYYSRQGMNKVEFYENYRYSYINGIGSGTGDLAYKDLTTSYLGVDIINKFSFKKLNFQFGPGLEFVVNSPDHVETDIDLTINLGFGYDITERLGVEARFKKGLIEPLKYQSNYFTVDNGRMTNSVFQVGLSYKLK
ncbi:outer membrane beta-barrel protein [Flavobacterium sp. HSC-61S13]|uniref:outer membrane beta-barrel protein n=1 Tax=Flavobacterium sp. HSC-61S13 TaxID=2910963 RepID=UPI00209D3975|nr:outer membrane beta-barrel protein [Flavobacterium sp. HSC-61S13]MCP1996331.1 hypothetical protein [Flavobacterium sp. HSC-61S13]